MVELALGHVAAFPGIGLSVNTAINTLKPRIRY